MKITPQQEKILEIHRDMEWHCSTSYEFIRDHRKRISELNSGYLLERGYQLVAKKCDGRCGKIHNSMVAMRRAEKIGATVQPTQPQTPTRAPYNPSIIVSRFDRNLSAQEIFA